jgi:hypothetical protein
LGRVKIRDKGENRGRIERSSRWNMQNVILLSSEEVALRAEKLYDEQIRQEVEREENNGSLKFLVAQLDFWIVYFLEYSYTIVVKSGLLEMSNKFLIEQ